MASAIAVLSNLQCVLYATVAAVAAILYDQILNFSQEVDFIWNRHWTIVTALYFVARYCGSASQLAYVAAYLPLDWTAAGAKSINIAFQVLNIMFTTAMQAILLIRAYALCNRSRKVLVFLLVSFVCEMAAIVVVLVKTLDLTAMGGFETYMVRIGSVIDPLSTQSYAVNLWQTISRATQLAFDILLLVVALFGSVQHALETKRFTKGWSINPLVKILVEDQIAYFVWYAAWQGTNMTTSGNAGDVDSTLAALNSLFGAFAIIAGPRMVISLRAQELKTREGTLQTHLSTIQFIPREPTHTHSSGSRREVDAEA